MIAVVLASLGLLSPPLDDAALSPTDLAAYQEAKFQAQRQPEAHIRLALWCEAHGLKAERLKHLAVAVLADPKNATARGLLGLVRYGESWQKPDDVARKVKEDAGLAKALAEYNSRREKAPKTANAQWELALWCEREGLRAEAFAHFSAVVRLDPGRESAWKRLGYKKHHGRWMTAAQIAAIEADQEAQKKADRHWKPLLEKWKSWLGEKARAGQAAALLAEITDPRAVPAVCTVFGTGRPGDQLKGVQVLGQIDCPAASRALAVLAVFGKSDEVRRAATETLKCRDAREYADILISLLRQPIKYEVRPVAGPGSPGAIFVGGKKFNLQMLYTPPPVPSPFLGGGLLALDSLGQAFLLRPFFFQTDMAQHGLNEQQARALARTEAPFQGFPQSLTQLAPALQQFNQHNENLQAQLQQKITRELATPGTRGAARTVNAHKTVTVQGEVAIPLAQFAMAAQRAAMAAQQQLQNDVAAIDEFNDAVRENNEKVAALLNEASDSNLPAEPQAWKAWWIDQLGYRYPAETTRTVPTLTMDVPIAYIPQPLLFDVYASASVNYDFRRISCFGAGTLVRSLSGSRPIEDLCVGDLVLTQDTKTGALSYRPVLVVHHNPPSKTFTISLGGETIVSSPFHRFWQAGKGWIMARDLKPGDAIRTLSGLARVTTIDEGPVQKVYNLDVAETASFFVGEDGALVHDNTLPSPVLQPFDAQPVLGRQPSESRAGLRSAADAAP